MKWRHCLLFAGLVCLLAAATASAETEEAKAKFAPWSGYWWPIKEGDLIKGPLTKYDQATGHSAADWEKSHNPPGPNVPGWHGYCHAWSAASVTEKEPIKGRTTQTTNGNGLDLGISDQKGMLTACHTQDLANTYGQRYNGPSDDFNDLYPDELWRVLKLYIKQQGVPIILDIDPGVEVWNYPVYAYRVDYSPTSGDEYQGTMAIWMADDGVTPGYVGTKVAKQTYQFTFRMQNGNVVAGSGRWIGASVKNHPDFAWYPYVAVAENPEVKYDAVKKLVDASGAGPNGGGGEPPPAPPVVDPNNPPQPPQPPPNPPNPVDPPNPPNPPPQTHPQHVLALSPLELLALVTNKTSNFDVSVQVDKFSGGQYVQGEKFTVTCSSERPGYLYLFYMDSQGGLKLLFPQPNQDNRIKSKEPLDLPGPKDDFTFQTAGPSGTHRVRAVVTNVPLVLTGLAPQQYDTKPEQCVVKTKQGQTQAQTQDFNLNPSMKQQVQQVVQQFTEGQPIKSEQVGDHNPKDFLQGPKGFKGEFGQGESVFYVGKSRGKP